MKREKRDGVMSERAKVRKVDLALIYFFVPLEVTVGKHILSHTHRGRGERGENKQVSRKLTVRIGSDMRE